MSKTRIITYLLILSPFFLPPASRAQEDSLAALRLCPNVRDIFDHPTRVSVASRNFGSSSYSLINQIDSTNNLYSHYDPYYAVSTGQSPVLLITYPYHTDPILNFRTQPSGEEAWMRLGDVSSNAKEQRISFLYQVDTLVSNMLVLKYSAVLQGTDRNHTYNQKPKFTFHILDSAGNDIDSQCYSAEFVSDSLQDWQLIQNNGGEYYYKPWTVVGAQLNNVHGQTIRIDLSAFDCTAGGHLGYAYFTLGCTKFEIQHDYCSQSDTFVFIAPEGFNHTWHSPLNPDSILSTSRILRTADTGTYICRTRFVGADTGSDCYTETICHTRNQYLEPHLSLDTIDTVGCAIRYRFHNQSIVRIIQQGDTIISPSGRSRWVVDGTDTINAESPLIELNSGLHRVTLLAMLSNGNCTDTLSQQIIVPDFCHCLDTIYDTVPQNALPWHFLGHTFYGETDTLIYYHQGSHQWVNGTFDCDSIYDYHLRLWPNITDTIIYYLCTTDLPLILNGQQLTDEGCTPVDTLTGSHGEDSTVVACLHILSTSDTTIYDTITDTQLPRPFLDSLFTDSVTDCIFHLYNEAGCDSNIHYNLHIFWNGDHCDTALSFPNVVTPNGDGVNDRFVIGGLLENKCFKYNELTIYNRHGRQVYHRRNIHDEKDWWTPGKHTPADTYFYYFKAHGVNIYTQHRGVIVLLKDGNK